MKTHKSKAADGEDSLLSVWRIIDDMRGPGRSANIAEVLKRAAAKGIKLTWDDLHKLSVKVRRHEGFIIPPYVARFIAAYLEPKKPQSILDPAAGVGSMIQPVAACCHAAKAQGVTPSPGQMEIASLMDPESIVEWRVGTPEQAVETSETFELVVSSPPLGMPPTSSRIATPDGTVKVRDSGTNMLALKAASRLSGSGEALLILPNSFFLKKRSKTAREVLPDLGLHVNTVLSLPAGTFAPFTAIELNLVFISRHEMATLFVGQLHPDRDPSALLDNLRKRKAGVAPELGRLIQPDEFRGWHLLAVQAEKERLAVRGLLKPFPLRYILKEINLRKPGAGDFEDLPNSVYLPLSGASPAVTKPSDLQIEPHNCAQLVVDSDKTHAEFLAGFFNSPIGRRTREGLQGSSVSPRISKQTLLGAEVFLPPARQKTVVDVSREIKELQLGLEQLHQEVWNHPFDAKRIRKRLATLNRKASLEGWLEILPFPLASILRRYEATRNTEQKNTHLLDFFEAATQFLGTLMISAFHSDQAFFQEHKQEWFETGKGGPQSLRRSTFGEWVVRSQRLAESTRQLLSNEDMRALCLNLYGTNNEKIETITNQDIYAGLQRIGRYRNSWTDHAGITGDTEQERRLTILEEELTRLRGTLGTVFDDWWLIRPGANEYYAGIYIYRVEKLMGRDQIFKEVELETLLPMDSRELYFYDTTTRQPLQILHFFRMMPNPEPEAAACYFYNRLEKDGIRWVSYHLAGHADRIEPDPSMVELIDQIEGDR